MKKILPIIKNVITKGCRSFSAVVLLLILLGTTKSAQAQVYYLINSTTGNTTNAANALKKVDYTGSNDGNVTTGIPNPILAEVDAPNNRVFTYNGFLGNRVINVVNMSTGGVINTITLPSGLQTSGPSVTAIKYDPINDWVYYVTNSNGGSATLNAVYRSKPDGTQNAALATNIATLPQWLALDIPNNRIFIYEGVFNSRKILTFDLSSNMVTGNAPVNNIANAIAYDPITDYLYYITSDNDQINAGTTNDALRKIRPGGSGGEIVIKSSLVKSPQYMVLDAGNNRAFVYNGYYGSSTTIRLDDTGIYSVDLTTGATTRILDHSGLQNTPNYLRVYALFAPARPNVNTTAVSTFSSASATLGGNVTRSDAAVTARGVVYSSSNTTPTIGGSGVTQASIGTGTGSFSQSISGFSASTTYYVRSYATSGAGTTYGTVTSFSTQSNDANLSAFTISTGTLTPGFSSGTISYTASVANANSTITVTPTTNNANASIKVNNVAVTSGTASGAINLNIGDNVITTLVTAQDGTTTKTYTLTVNRPKAAQTITFAGTATKTYGDADFAPGASASSGLGISFSSDNLGVATIVSGQIHIVGAGTANITASQGGDGTYLAASNVVQALTVNKASQTITFNVIPAKNYGIADFAPGATASSGLTVSYSSDNTAVATIVSNQIHIVGQGTANITASQVGDANRLAATSIAQVLTVNKATVTITANAQTKVYGDNDPAFTYTATGVVGTDAPTGALSRATPNTNVLTGTYAIEQGTLSYGSNYNINYTGANLTITPRPITILPVAKTKVYGDADPFLNQFSIKAGSLAPGDATGDQFGRATGENIGSYLMTLGAKKFYGNVNGNFVEVTNNYDITVQSAYFIISAKPIIVSANAQTKIYGDPDPEFTYSNDALAFSDSFTGALTRAPGEGFGTYTITQGTLALNSNYTLTFNGNNLTIGKKTINVTANAKNKTYGTADPAFDYTYDALAFTDGFTGSLTRDAGEDVGTHAITQGSLALSNNYTLNYTSASLSISKANLTYVATPASRPFQTANPTFAGSVTGFVNGDSQASATTGTLSFTSTAGLNSALGNYPIIGSGLSAANYDFVQDAANSTALTITASTDATLANLTVDQGTLNPVFSSGQTSYGFSVANNVTSINLMATVNQQNATLQFTGGALTSGITKNVSLNTGNNNFNVIVTAQDGSTTKYYTLNIFRAYDTNNLLASLNLGGLVYSPAFDTNTLNYTASVSNLVTSTDVTATAVSPTTHIFVSGYDLATTNPVTTSLNIGATDVIIVSKAENGDERIYKVTVTREQSADATLASIGNNTITLNTPFISALHTYSATVADNVALLVFNPTASSAAATLKINNQSLIIGLGNTINLAFGANTIVFDITAEDGTHTSSYTLNVYRLRSSDATLASLSFPFITSLNEEFNPNVFEYTADVADSTYTGIPLRAISANENSIVKIDGTVVPRFQNYTLPVHGGPNTYHVMVTSQDTSATKTYTLVLTRAGTPPPAQSPVANLLALTLTGNGTFSKNFNFSFDALAPINVANTVTSMRIFPVSENAVSTITVNGVTVPYDTATDFLPLSLGDNVFTILVTSEDGNHTKTYDLHVNRLPYADVSLASLTLSNGTLTPVFNPNTKTYTASVPNTIANINVTPVATDNTTTVKIGATIISSSTPHATVALNVGLPNRVRVVVTAADGVTTQTYTVNVTRELSAVTGASFALTPSSKLIPAAGTANINYISSVDPSVTSITIKPTLQDAAGTLTINGTPATNNEVSAPIILNSGPTLITISVTAANGTTVKTYGITVNRNGSNNSNIDLKLNPASQLVLTTGSSTVNYVTTVDPAITSVNVIPVAQNVNAVIMVDGTHVNTGTASQPITLNVAGATVINTVVTSQDGSSTKTYSITVNRIGSNNAIATFKLNPLSTLTQVAGPSTLNYVTSVDPGTTSVSVIPTTQNAGATVTVNGSVVTSGAPSSPVSFVGTTAVINVLVTAQDGVTTKTYTITVNRTGSTNAFAILKLDPAATLTTIDGPGTVNYTTTVAPTTASVKLTTTLQEPNATIKVNGVTQASGVPSASIPLAIGANTISAVITAQDGVTVRSYIIMVTRPKSNNVIASLRLTPASSLVTTTGTNTINYAAFVSPATNMVTVTTTADDPNATITVNGVTVASGTASTPVTLTGSATLITTVITAEDGITTRSYGIMVNKTGSNNAVVKLKLNPASTLVATTGTGTVNYNAFVAPDVTSVNLTPVAQDATATIVVNGNTVVTGTASPAIALDAGPTVIVTVVTAQDGVTVKTYNITVYRTGSNNAILSSIKLSPNKLLTTTTGTATVNYTANVDFGTSTISVVPIAQQANATIDVMGQIVATGATSMPISLNVGANTILTTVTAQDGSTIKTYSITVNRASDALMVDRYDSKLLFANKAANNVAPTGNDGVVVHQGVSPNGDGANDFLYIEGISAYAGNKLSIMNTSGLLVFETKDYGKDGNNLFNGHSNKNGTLLKPGTYFYALEYQVEKQNKRKTGYIIIKY